MADDFMYLDAAVDRAREAQLEELIGRSYGRLTVIDSKLDEGAVIAILECSCGYVFEARASSLAVLRACTLCRRARRERAAS